MPLQWVLRGPRGITGSRSVDEDIRVEGGHSPKCLGDQISLGRGMQTRRSESGPWVSLPGHARSQFPRLAQAGGCWRFILRVGL